MQELHKVREELGVKWKGMSIKEMLHSINESAKKSKTKNRILSVVHR